MELDRSKPLRLEAHAQAPRSQIFRRWARETGRPLALDLFSGAGGLSLGLEDAGYVVALSVDNDPWALETHRHNLPGVCLDLDLSDPNRIDSLIGLVDGLEIDLVAGGPPCQPFSRAGRAKLRSLVDEGIRDAQDERAGLWRSFIEVVERIRPASVLMENVPDMALGDDMAVVRVMIERLEKAGYDVEVRLVEAWRYGVPQHRERLILVANRDGRPFQWPGEAEVVTLREAIGDLPGLRGSTGCDEMRARKARTSFQKTARKGMNDHPMVWDHVTRAVRPDDLEAFRLMKPGTRYGELPRHLRRYRDDIFGDKYNRLDWDDVSRSITAHIAKDGYWYIHPSEHRTLTVREAARIQTFPDRFRFAGTRSHAFRQIGNAVPPVLAEAVARELLKSGRRRRLPASRRVGQRMMAVRKRLLAWAGKDAVSSPWRHPGDPWVVLAGILLGDRVGSGDEGVRRFLGSFPKPQKGISARIRRAAHDVGGHERKGYERMAVAAAEFSRRGRWESLETCGKLDLGPQERGLFGLMALGGDDIVPSRSSLRVMARLSGSHVDRERSMSDGRIELGRAIGVEEGGSRLNAALHGFGRVVCTTADPSCPSCPLGRYCVSASL